MKMKFIASGFGDGPTLLVWGTARSLVPFQERLEELARGAVGTKTVFGPILSGVVDERDSGLEAADAGKTAFLWRLSLARWSEFARAVRSLIDHGGAAHQYLETKGDCAVVTVSTEDYERLFRS